MAIAALRSDVRSRVHILCPIIMDGVSLAWTRTRNGNESVTLRTLELPDRKSIGPTPKRDTSQQTMSSKAT